MRVFNRILLVIILVVVFVFALFTAIHALVGNEDYQAAGLPSFLSIPLDAAPAGEWLTGFEDGNITWWMFAILVVVGVLGLLLLVMELAPRRVPMVEVGERLRVERKVVEKEAERVALAEEGVLESSARLKGGRRRGMRLAVDVTARNGQDPGEVEGRVGRALAVAIGERGEFPLSKTTVKASLKDPRDSKRRVS